MKLPPNEDGQEIGTGANNQVTPISPNEEVIKEHSNKTSKIAAILIIVVTLLSIVYSILF